MYKIINDEIDDIDINFLSFQLRRSNKQVIGSPINYHLPYVLRFIPVTHLPMTSINK